MDFSEQRLSYEKGDLTKANVPDSPFKLLDAWLNDAIAQKVPEPYAMSLATCGNDGKPGVRVVLMRELTENGVVFYTNYNSAKGDDLADNANAEVLFFWHELERQVRVGGTIEKISEQQSTAYFHKRPHDSQVAAWVSQPQSGTVESRAVMEDKFTQLKQKYPEGSVVPKPDFWGGYKLSVQEVEFWQGRANRMHDRLQYTLMADQGDNIKTDKRNLTWAINRLLP